MGPRGARVHFGSGRTGVSTGAGPFTYYTSGSSSARTGAGARGPTKAQLAQAEKEGEFLRLREELRAIVEVHRIEFPAATKLVVAANPAPDLEALVKQRENELLQGISLLKWAERKTAKARAKELAHEDLQNELKRLESDREKAQAEIDAEWNRLTANDPETVIATVEAAFRDNEAPAAPVNVEGSSLDLVVLVPGLEDVPERKPALTPSGKPTVKKMTKLERSDMYLTLVCGHVLATIKEALATAPNISEVRSVVVRQTSPDVYGNPRMEALLAASYARSNLDRVRWRDALPSDIVQEAAEDLLWELKGRPPQLQPLDLEQEPSLRTFVEALGDRAGGE